ncbi:hypothetical protein POM88_043676 [Heracleum sosnowskyi]|uniref:Uncharacterized protein n=1 Tax=Heracleum sosnowskyi TaxID=360622 RepID=A0AAD8H3Z9_9APIA|nr:hypothetical protein POM88_043676 [Heracleum sosnowskyi]
MYAVLIGFAFETLAGGVAVVEAVVVVCGGVKLPGIPPFPTGLEKKGNGGKPGNEKPDGGEPPPDGDEPPNGEGKPGGKKNRRCRDDAEAGVMFAENVKDTRIIERMNNLQMAILLFLHEVNEECKK